MKYTLYILLFCLPFIGVSQEVNRDSLRHKNDELRARVMNEGQVTIIDTSGEVPVKKVIVKGELKNEMIMFKAEEDEIHPADARNIPIKRQKWTMGMALVESENGLRVDEIKQGLSAEKAGIRLNDILVSMEGTFIRTREEFFTIWDEVPNGSIFHFSFQQGNKEYTVELEKE